MTSLLWPRNNTFKSIDLHICNGFPP